MTPDEYADMVGFQNALEALPPSIREKWGRLLLASESMADVVRAGLEGKQFGEFHRLFESALKNFELSRSTLYGRR